MAMYTVNATRHLKRSLQWEIRKSEPSVTVIGGCMLIVLVKLLYTVIAATECVQIVFCNLKTFMCAMIVLLLLFGWMVLLILGDCSERFYC